MEVSIVATDQRRDKEAIEGLEMKASDENSVNGQDVVTALRLMRLALPLLDRAGQGLAAARLQHAMDAVRGASPAALQDEQRPDHIERIMGDHGR